MGVVDFVDGIGWAPHPFLKGVSVKFLVTKRDHGADVTCMLAKVPKGGGVPEHVHEGQWDIIYPLSGRAKMWVDGEGVFALERGMIVRVPRNTRHRIFDVEEDLLLYDVFSPPLI
jgi:quercetin dioxygenase-like cupin family protein